MRTPRPPRRRAAVPPLSGRAKAVAALVLGLTLVAVVIDTSKYMREIVEVDPERRIARVQPGERVVVIGTGAIGLIAVQVGVAMGCQVDVIGIDDAGLRAAEESGAVRAVRPEDAPHDVYDAVIEASGAGAIAPLVTALCAVGGRIMAVGIPGKPVDGVDLAAFVSKGLRLEGVLGGVHLLPRALQLIAQGAIRPELLLEEVLPSAAVAEAFERCAAPGRGRPKVVLDLSTLGEPVAGA